MSPASQQRIASTAHCVADAIANRGQSIFMKGRILNFMKNG
jgi:hypothetical protein